MLWDQELRLSRHKSSILNVCLMSIRHVTQIAAMDIHTAINMRHMLGIHADWGFQKGFKDELFKLRWSGKCSCCLRCFLHCSAHAHVGTRTSAIHLASTSVSNLLLAWILVSCCLCRRWKISALGEELACACIYMVQTNMIKHILIFRPLPPCFIPVCTLAGEVIAWIFFFLYMSSLKCDDHSSNPWWCNRHKLWIVVHMILMSAFLYCIKV